MIEGILVAILVVALLVHSIRKPKHYPPGPFPLPFLGSFHAVDHQNPQRTIDGYHATYGSHAGLLMGMFKVVVVSEWDALCEVFANEDLLGRPDVCIVRDRFDGEKLGVLFTDGDDWRTQRRFSLHHFRNLGFGRRNHEAVIHEEAEALVEVVKGTAGKAFHLEDFISPSVINITWALLGGQRYDHSDKEIVGLAQSIRDSIHSIKMFGSIAIAFPFLRYIFPETTGHRRLVQGSRGVREFVKKAIREHKKTRDANNPRDFIDIYLEELTKPEVNPSFSEPQLEGMCTDMLCAGGDTTNSVINFAILFLCLRKDLQNKIHEEVLEHVGSNRLPSTEDKPNLVYTEAVLMETLRTRTPAPTTIPHRAVRDTMLGEYFIPKDTLLVLNVNSVLMDKEYWTDPDTFRPERFITPEGKIRRDERLIPFGRGKRNCIGEALARSSSFILLATMVQKFSFTFDPNLPIPETAGVPGYTMAAPFFQIVATPRN